MISEERIIREIDAASLNFIWCWERFRKLRRFEVELQDLFQFQVRLTEGISQLDQTYRRIKGEQEHLVRQKARYRSEWFVSRMAILDVYLKAVKEAIGIGRCLGDGFAWIFYRGESELLEEHAKEQRQLLLPPAIGGIGERAFIEKMQGLGGRFVLYHAITSYLRLGDVSFFNPVTGGITAIGEIKTRHLGGDRYNITLAYVAADAEDLEIRGVKPSTAEDRYTPLDKPMQQRLDRQMRQLSSALSKRMKSGDNPGFVSRGQFHFDALERLLRECEKKSFYQGQAGPGLMLAAWRLRHRDSLGKRLLKANGNPDAAIAVVKESVSAILDPDLADNSLFVGSLACHEAGYPPIIKGGLPMLWWPLADQQMHDLLFGHVMVMTLFNPAQLWGILRSRGYEVFVNSRSSAVKLTKLFGKRRIELENFPYFEQLVTHALMDEYAIADMVDAWVEQSVKAAGDQPTVVKLKPRIMTGINPVRDKQKAAISVGGGDGSVE
jgi:hypothetical protein